MTNISVGTTVRGPISVYNKDMTLETLVDKHMVVLQIQGANAMCLYTGTDDNSFSRLPGYVAFPSESNCPAGWKVNGRFYCDAAKMCSVPVALLKAEGRVSAQFLAKLMTKIATPEVAKRREVTVYSPLAMERVTGFNRQVKSGMVLC